LQYIGNPLGNYLRSYPLALNHWLEDIAIYCQSSGKLLEKLSTGLKPLVGGYCNKMATLWKQLINKTRGESSEEATFTPELTAMVPVKQLARASAQQQAK
jgi:hypothetical protein